MFGFITSISLLFSTSLSLLNIISSLYVPIIAPPEPVNFAQAPAERANSTIYIAFANGYKWTS